MSGAGLPGPAPAPEALAVPAPGVVVRPATYGRNFSYFSHRIFVAHQPGELHDFLARLLFVDGQASPGDRIEIELVRWVLLHRSQLNPLALNRLIEAWRGPTNELAVPGRDGARSDEYRVDITIEFVIELELARTRHARWLQDRPHLQQARLDAAYFVSRQLPERDPEQTAGETASAQAVLDLSPRGRAAFRDYLTRRMNLAEDSDAAADRRRAGHSGNDAALGSEDLQALHELALGVARTLASSTSADTLKERWEMHVGDPRRAGYGEAPAPSDAVYAALLTGDLRVLGPDPAGSEPDADGLPRRFIWRTLASGLPSTAAGVSESAQRSRQHCADIDAADRLLRQAMWGLDATDTTPAPAALGLLSDDMRVLPTTPPWSGVAMARFTLTEAAAGRGKANEVATAVATLADYAQMLRSPDNASAASHALLLAAVLAGIRQKAQAPARERPDEGDWRAALQLVCDGLALDTSNPAAAAASLGHAWRAMSQRIDGLPAVTLALPHRAEGLPWPPALADAVATAFVRGRDNRDATGDDVAHAWQSVQLRLGALAAAAAAASTAPPPPASASELLAAARQVGPFPLLGLRPDKLPLRAWTALLISAFDQPKDRAASGLPLTLAAHALERMGVRALGPERRQAWLDASTLSPEQRSELRDYAERQQLWAGGLDVPAVALVLGAATDTSPSDGWSLPPAKGMVIRATEQELLVLAQAGLARALDSLGPLRVAWEPAVADSADQRGLRRALRPLHSGNQLRELWLFRPGAVGSQRPRLVDAKSADELWQDLPESA